MPEPGIRLCYNDSEHYYTVNGSKTPGISTTAKIVPSTYLLERWTWRQIALGFAIDPHLVENVACHKTSNRRIDEYVQKAKDVAGAFRKADRGTQMHRVLELVLLGAEDELLTDQQRRDRDALAATLDRYSLKATGYAERFVYYDNPRLAGRMDAVLADRDGRKVLSDLKSGYNSIKYADTTSIQLALYAHAPWVAAEVETDGDRTTVTRFEPMPAVDQTIGYVLHVEPDAAVGDLYEIDLTAGWAGAQIALDALRWRAANSWGAELARKVDAPLPPELAPSWRQWIEAADTRESLRLIWTTARNRGELTPQIKGMCVQRSQQLGAS